MAKIKPVRVLMVDRRGAGARLIEELSDLVQEELSVDDLSKKGLQLAKEIGLLKESTGYVVESTGTYEEDAYEETSDRLERALPGSAILGSDNKGLSIYARHSDAHSFALDLEQAGRILKATEQS